MNKTEKEALKLLCTKTYREYVETAKIDPSQKEFNHYWSSLQQDSEEPLADWKKAYKNITELRIATLKEFPEISDMTFNESTFTEEYIEQLEQEVKKHKRFVVSTIVAGKPANVDYYRAVQNYARRNKALLLLLPIQDVKGSRKQFEFNFDPIFKDSWVLTKGMYLNTNLFFEDIRQSAKQKNQLASLEKGTSFRNASLIVPGTKQQLKYVPTLKGKIPHAIMTAPAMTINDYMNEYYMSARTSRFAEWDHQCGSVIVEVENEKVFHFRQIKATADGSFTDLNTVYHSDGTVEEAKGSILVMGDSHSGMHDRELFSSVLNQLAVDCDIDTIVLHDICNSSSISHHEESDYVLKAQRAADGTNKILNDATEVSRYLNVLTELFREVVVVNSNHDTHIDRAIKELRCVTNKDYVNMPIELDIWSKVVSGEVKIPLKYLVEKYTQLNDAQKIKWLETDEDYTRYGSQLGMHGHLGANGGRGSLKTFENAIGNAVVGHTHTGAIQGDVFQVGTTSEMDMKYNKGLSSWTRTCCLVHADGTKQLINFIPVENGEYHYTNRV